MPDIDARLEAMGRELDKIIDIVAAHEREQERFRKVMMAAFREFAREELSKANA